MGSWDPNCEELETESGKGGEIPHTRNKNGVSILNTVKGPNSVNDGPKRAKNSAFFASRSLIYGIYCDYQKSRSYTFRGNNSE